MPRTPLLLLPLLACNQDYQVTREAICDGLKQASEATVDAPFDIDGDGYFDANNPGCADTYAADALDCDEGHAEVHPGAAEVACNGLDDDCDAATPDAEDVDGDGFDSCEDCDDDDAAVSPDAAEIECNDLDDDCDPETLDYADRDGDGANSCVDCDDDVASTHPGGTEILCNEVDDDCNPETLDDFDQDGDGTDYCDDDCDDEDAERSPDLEEVCGDGVDNDCDEDVDEGCTLSDPWNLSSTVSYSCAYGLVSVNFNRVTIVDSNPVIQVIASGSQPGTMTGAWTSASTFETENVLTGTCNEYYDFDGTVISETQLSVDFDIRFSGTCFNCTAQSYTLTATR
ncbi:MAG: putative metal-binding motif-containing protein [Pseudomonadota bacterium]